MRTRVFFIIIGWVTLFSLDFANGQRFGLPGIRNFSRSEYLGGTQNWSLAQAANGMIYFGNNNGLLEYDGAHWTLYHDLNSVVRAVSIDGNRIYVGAFNKFGFYEEDSCGILKYHSLSALLKAKDQDFDEIWRIYKTSFGIIFQSFKALFIYDNGKIEVVYPRSRFHFSFYINGILWIYDEAQGLMQYREGKVRVVPHGSFFAGQAIWSVLSLNDDVVLIGTVNNGFYRYNGEHIEPWENQVNTLLRKHQLFHATKIDPSHFAFGTIQDGLLVSDTSGKVVFEINREKGLLNNTVLSVGNDKEGNIWLGLDNGISLVRFNSPLTFIQNYFNLGTGYSSALVNNTLYLGTNQGLFYIPWNKFIDPLKQRDDFKLIKGTEGQVWCLADIEDVLLCGHNAGIFQIINDQAIKISEIPGGWNFTKPLDKPGFLYAGTYSGVSVLEKKGKYYSFRNQVSDYDQSSHYLHTDETGNIWISHGYKGIFCITPDENLGKVKKMSFYNHQQGLPSDMSNALFKIRSKIVITTPRGIYRFSEQENRFYPDTLFNQMIPGIKQVDYLSEDPSGNIWYYNDQKVGVLRLQEDGSYKNIHAPFVELTGKIILPFGHVNVINGNTAVIGLEDGFALYQSGSASYAPYIPELYISQFNSGDTTEGKYRLSSLNQPQKTIPAFHYRNNTITISFAAGQFAERPFSYQFYLKGFDTGWSEWTSKNSKEYTNLPPGEYTFSVKGLTINGLTTPNINFRFRILPPWYRTTLAWIVYLFITAILLLLAYRYFIYYLKKSRQKEQQAIRMNYLQREQKLKEDALVAEKEMIRLRNERLNLDMIHKEKELANSTMSIIQKNEILQKLRNELQKIRSVIPDENTRNEINITIRKIGKEIDNENQWQVFDTHVKQVHEDFFRSMKSRFPDLTPRELSLCAYLKMNISSKEIATLMNISTRGVEISRYRIRRKLGLDRNANLTEFMLTIS